MCRDHKIEYLQDAAKKLKTMLDEKVSVLEFKQKEIQDNLTEYNTFMRNHAQAKDYHLSKFEAAAEAEEKEFQQDITEKLSKDTAELFKTKMQVQQAIDNINQVKESGDVHVVSAKFANLVENAEKLSQIKPKLELTEEERLKLANYELPDLVAEDTGTYKLKGKALSLEFRLLGACLIFFGFCSNSLQFWYHRPGGHLHLKLDIILVKKSCN